MMKNALHAAYVLVVTLALISGCGTGPINTEKRDGNYLIITDLPDVSIAQVGYKGVAPTVRAIANRDWNINSAVGKAIEQVVAERVQGKGIYVDDAEIINHLSYGKMLVMRKLDADAAEFIRSKHAADSIDYLVLVTKARLGMSDLSGVGLRQKDIPFADFHCQFFTAMQLDVYELATGKLLSTLTESLHEDCPVGKYFDDVTKIDDKALGEIQQRVVRMSTKTANKIARHLLMTDAEKDEFKLRPPGFE